MSDLIERGALFNALSADWDKAELMMRLQDAPAVSAVRVPAELVKVVQTMVEEYDIGQQLDYVYNPLGFALYRTWEIYDLHHDVHKDDKVT